MGRLEKLKREAINEANQRVLNEQFDNPLKVTVPTDISHDAANQSVNIGYSTVDITGAVIAVLSALGAKFINDKVREKKEDQLVELLNDVNVKLKTILTGTEYSCLSSNLSKMGKLTKLNDDKKRDKALKVYISCLDDKDNKHRVEEVKKEINKAIQDIEDKKEENKKIRKFR